MGWIKMRWHNLMFHYRRKVILILRSFHLFGIPFINFYGKKNFIQFLILNKLSFNFPRILSIFFPLYHQLFYLLCYASRFLKHSNPLCCWRDQIKHAVVFASLYLFLWGYQILVCYCLPESCTFYRKMNKSASHGQPVRP